jgi:membrane protein DedA with SNARE-associated domain
MDLLLDALLDFYGIEPYLIIFGILLACGFGLPIPEDITLIVAGALVYYRVLSLPWAIAVGLAGVLIGDSIMFLLGKYYGRKLTQRWFFKKLLPEERLDAVGRQLDQRGDKLLFAARFMPGLRAPIFFSAGVLHLPFRKFILYDGLAALISVPAIIAVTYKLGDQLEKAVSLVKKAEYGILTVIALVILYFVGKWLLKRRKQSRESAVALKESTPDAQVEVRGPQAGGRV